MEREHEIKHDGHRLMARRDPAGIRLAAKNPHDGTDRYPSARAVENGLAISIP